MQALLKADAEVTQLSDEASSLEVRANELIIQTDVDATEATNILGFIATAKKKLEEKRTFFVGPLNGQVKNINNLFKQYNAPLDNADGTLRRKVLAYRQEQVRQQRKEEERLRKLAEKEQQRIEKKAEKKGLPAPPPLVMPVIKSAPKTMQATLGSATMKTAWDFQVVDENLVPREYLVVDEKKIRAVVKAGIRNIPGVRIYQDDKLAVRAR